MSADEKVHLWHVALDVDDARLAQLRALLSEEETERAQRLRAEPIQRSFIARRGMLRELLGRYLDMPPQEVAIKISPHGKPMLGPQHAPVGLEFNISSAGDLALMAMTQNRQVGVDVELERQEIEPLEIASRFFAPGERADLQALEPHERRDAFFQIWTLKEAYVKAAGPGFFLALDSFEMQADPPQLRKTAGAAEEMARWTFKSWRPLAGYRAALAVEGGAWELCTWTWPPGAPQGWEETPE